MDLDIIGVTDYGTHASERVELNVLNGCNLHFYLLADTTFVSEGKISNKFRHMYRFQKQDVNTGDEVYLYTKKGTAKTESINGGKNTRYIYYWGVDSFIWNDNGDGAILFEISSWKTRKVE